MDEGLPFPVTVTRVVEETPSVRTIRFDHRFPFVPGQFVMVWVPGVDEVPMALSAQDAVSVQRVGPATEALCSLRPGDMIGIRGPFGNGFPGDDGILAVAGGIGAAPLLPLARTGRVKLFLIGARTGCELPFVDEIREFTEIAVATDDGTRGHHGTVAGLLSGYRSRDFSRICVCGPEPMMHAVLAMLPVPDGDRGAFSLHRYMKCGIGVCGSCCIDPSGQRVCRDGPVFSGSFLRDSEFGRYKRGPCGNTETTWSR